ncbi:MAG TPA: lysophospholipid acyltransferase family protein [Verrucomicrobiae bacterium]|nr:lysophospholipid acyltransferase family protein [Verrucomicrobiae bacterium]
MMTTQNRTSGVVIPHQAKWHQRIAAALISIFIRGVTATIRFRHKDLSGYFVKEPPKTIFAVWHNRLALSAAMYQRYVRVFNSKRRMAAMVSASRDGGLLAQVLEHFGVEPVRGSSSRRGGQALIEMTSCAERGLDLAITPDGPRGPRYQAEDGVIVTAQLTGFPIVPVSYHLNWKIRLNSWDAFQIPLPFARCEVVLGRPISVPREISDDERESLRKQLEHALMEISKD